MLALDNGLFMLFVKRAPLSWTDQEFIVNHLYTGVLRAVALIVV
jgi:hypothetical protein